MIKCKHFPLGYLILFQIQLISADDNARNEVDGMGDIGDLRNYDGPNGMERMNKNRFVFDANWFFLQKCVSECCL